MNTPRGGHSGTLLRNGKALIAGGVTRDASGKLGFPETAELWDPATGTFTPTGSMLAPRVGHSAIMLADGRVLMAGGASSRGSWTRDLEIYHPEAGDLRAAGQMLEERVAPAIVRLQDGKVLICGGIQMAGEVILQSAEVYDPVAAQSTSTGGMAYPRYGHSATLLPSGKVLITGYDRRSELYDPATGRFSVGAESQVIYDYYQSTATALPDGRVLNLGHRYPDRLLTAQLYDPVSDAFVAQAGEPLPRRMSYEATALQDGRVLVSGGYPYAGKPTNVVHFFVPADRAFAPSLPMLRPRSSHSATLLADGRVLIAGGSGPSGETLGSTEIFVPEQK